MKIIVIKMLSILGNKVKCLKRFCFKIRDSLVFGEIKKIYENIDNNNNNNNSFSTNSNKIWIYWGQGYTTAPELVKTCINQAKKCFNGYDVVILDDRIISKYVEIPDYIIKKYNKGKISHAHFSDLLRIYLLEKHGGIWIDSTVFVSQNINEYINDCKDFVSINQDNIDYNVSKGKWSIWFMGIKHYKSYLTTFKDFYRLYWKKHNHILCYFLTDYLLEYEYRTNHIFKKDIDMLPKTNFSAFELLKIRNNEIKQNDYINFLNVHFINKLSYKEGFKKDNKCTVSYYLFNSKE